MVERRLRITNQLGLHARAAAKLVRLSSGFASVVTLRYGDAVANAGSILDVLTLAAGFGKYVDVMVAGNDEDTAMEQIQKLFEDGFGEL